MTTKYEDRDLTVTDVIYATHGFVFRKHTLPELPRTAYGPHWHGVQDVWIAENTQKGVLIRVERRHCWFSAHVNIKTLHGSAVIFSAGMVSSVDAAVESLLANARVFGARLQ